MPCDCSRVTARIRSVRRGDIRDRQSTPFSPRLRPVGRDAGSSFPVGETSASHAGGRDVTRCGRPNCRNTAAANEWSQETEYSSPAENSRIFPNHRLCDGPPLARWKSLLRHPEKRPRPVDDAPSPAFEPGCVARIVGLCHSRSPGRPGQPARHPSDEPRCGSRMNNTAATHRAD